MLEKSIEKKCKRFIVETEHGRFIKLQGMGNAGYPDRLIVLPNGLSIFCELKKQGEKPRELQEKRMRTLEQLGHFVFWTDNYADFMMHVRHIQMKHQLQRSGKII